MKNLEKDGPPATEPGGDFSGPRTEPASDWHLQQQAAPPQLPLGTVPVDSLPIPQRLAMIEQALAGIAMAVQNAASRQGVETAVKEVDDKVAALDAKLSAFQGIVTEALSLTTRLDGLDRAVGEIVVEIQRLPSRAEIALVADNTGRVQGHQEAITQQLGRVSARLLRHQWWQLVSVVFLGAGVMLAGGALLAAVLIR